MNKYFKTLLWSIVAFFASYFGIIWAGFKGTVPVKCAALGSMSMRAFLPLRTPWFSFEVWLALIIAMFVFAILLPKESKYTKISWSVFFITLGIYICYVALNWPSCF